MPPIDPAARRPAPKVVHDDARIVEPPKPPAPKKAAPVSTSRDRDSRIVEPKKNTLVDINALQKKPSAKPRVVHDDARIVEPKARKSAGPPVSNAATATQATHDSYVAYQGVKDLTASNGRLPPTKVSSVTGVASGVAAVTSGSSAVNAARRGDWEKASTDGASAVSAGGASYSSYVSARTAYDVGRPATAARPALRTAAGAAARSAEPAIARTAVRAAGAGAVRAAGRFTPGVNIAIAAADTYTAAQTWRDPKASPAKKFTATLTAVGSVAAATNIPGVSQVGAGVSALSSFAGAFLG